MPALSNAQQGAEQQVANYTEQIGAQTTPADPALQGAMQDISAEYGAAAGGFASPTDPLVGVVDPTPTPIPGGTPGSQVPDDYVPPNAGTPPPESPPANPPADLGAGSLSDGTTVQDLYPDGGEIGDVVGSEVIGAEVTEADPSVTEFDASQTALTSEQQVDAELARILGEDSPLLAQARAAAAQQANARGLQNTSMAVGMSQAEMVKAALPMAQQNAQQGFQREMANTELSQKADELQAQMRTALEQGDQAAYNNAATQLAELDYRSSQANADAINQRNTQTIDSVTRLNQQFLQNMGAADLATIEGTYKQLIASNQAASGIYNSMLTAMADLMNDPKMTPQQVSIGIAAMQRSLEASMRMLGNINDMDFSAVTPTPGGPGIPTPGPGIPSPGTPGIPGVPTPGPTPAPPDDIPPSEQ